MQQQFSNSAYGLTYFLDSGMPRVTTIPLVAGTTSIDPTTIPNSTVYTLYSQPKDFPAGVTKSYNLSLQQELGHDTTFTLGFVGANARKLSYEIGNYNLGGHLSTKLGKVQTLLPIGLSNYSSMQANVTRRFSRGYSVIASYTWSHSLDNGEAPRDLSPSGGEYPQDPFNINAEYSNSDNDVRNNLTASQIIELPIGRGRRFLKDTGRLPDLLIGGWQLNSLTTLQGGTPFNVVASQNDPNYPGTRPNLTGINPHVSHRTIHEWFNPRAFTPVHQVAGKPPVFGDAPRNFLYGPGNTNEDLSLFKVLSLPREMKFQVRVEAFNVFNVAHYGNPISNLADGRAGSITGGYNARVMQFAGRLTF